METLREVVWDPKALAQLEKIQNYVEQTSSQNAKKLRREIIDKIERIPLHPEKYPLDRYRRRNKGGFRAFELHHIRVAYQITHNHIFIVRVRSTYQEPRQY